MSGETDAEGSTGGRERSLVSVLVVDGESGFADAAASRLESRDDRIEATPVESAAALDALSASSYDCVVSAYDLSGSDGVELLETVRERHGDVPFVLFTASGSEAVASEAISAGVDEYLRRGETSDQYARLADAVDDVVSSPGDGRRAEEHLERVSDAYCEVDADWRVTYLNDRAVEVIDLDAEDLLGERIWDLFPGTSGSDGERALREAAETGDPVRFEEHVDRLGADLVVNAYPTPDGVALYFRDVTEKREQERELRELSERLQLAVEGADVGVWDWNVRTDEVRFDEQWAEMIGHSADDLAFDLSTWEDRVHPHDIGDAWSAIEAHFAGEIDLYQCDYRMRTETDDWRWIRDRGRVVEWDEDGDPCRAVGIHIDITEEKSRERELERYRRVVDELPESVCIYDADGRIALANDHTGDVLESDPEALVDRESRLVDRIRATGDGDRFAALVDGERDSMAGTVEVELPREPAAIVDYGLTRLVIDGEFDGVLGISRDVTDERRRQRRLERTSARLEALFERSPDMIDIHDEAGAIVDANRAMTEELGYDREEIVGMDVWDVDQELSPEEGRRLWDGLDMDETVRLETTFVRADGSTFPVEVHVRRIDVQGEDRFLASSRDISERKAYERRIERENERLDEFASIVSHDLRNPLNVLSGYLRLARETGADSYFDRCERALDEMERLIEDVLTLAKQGEAVGSFEPVHLGDLAARYSDDAFGSADDEDPFGGDSGGAETDAAPIEVAVEADGEICADPGRVRQLLGNLFRNAAEHGGERVAVGDLPDGFYVEDDGPGIDPDERDRVFESGYTTSETGTGFGLPIVQRIAEAHGWTVDVTEGERGGARFEFTGVDPPDPAPEEEAAAVEGAEPPAEEAEPRD
ncbi:multi-sensor signal transduction histidine kinase [Halorubrum californiense DSM 19288]|uniref:histidine kinase n=1 Tax=Halorubrum californiense DSM 19288 TaxID=1227465 RepID=M0EDA9_9EURY|nr:MULTISPECIES: PAS domain S-box protein [Halorubrum]ELZ44872.1 multi-sensor signal transduction histidine kinase [Halorubrum californiense DSM 19288]TKX68438.1 PAS domain S-box protein [Halorubrum sp. GN11GM_10-3_MGM]